ncbi:MAG: hypothetical protein KAR03_10470 [Candidatus Thorarchaeota archaeon]|nr:hypothetical protein [Candidatus Thorarchaeota archaeon]
MAETVEGWKRVLKAFDDWISYETIEFGPYTGYFSLANLRDITHSERIGWMNSMYVEIIPGRVQSCKNAGVAFEDFLPYMPDPEARAVVQSMIDLTKVLTDDMLAMSDIIHNMKEDYESGGFDDAVPYLTNLAEAEENIRHHMSLFSQGFGKLKKMGLEMPDMES